MNCDLLEMESMTAYKLTDADRELADRLNAAEGTVWRGKAQMIIDVMSRANGTPVMAVQQSCAYALRIGVSTARRYVRLEETFGAVLDECRTPDGDEIVGPAQLREIYSAAKAEGADPCAVLIQRINSADKKWGGQVAPVDVLRAQRKNTKDPAPPLTQKLKRAARSLSTLARALEAKPDRVIVESWIKWIEKRLE